MRTTNQDEHALRDHVFSTYLTLRYGMAAMAIAFPPLLYLVGKFLYGIDLLPSMSQYYFAEATVPGGFPMRVWFVGLLFAIGAALYLYKGFTNWENVALNLAGACAALVALFPMDIACQKDCGVSLHGVFAVSLFLFLAFVAVFCAEATLPYLEEKDVPEKIVRRFRRRYKTIGLVMVLSPVAAVVITLLTNNTSRYTFFAEALGVWSFAAYWWVKSQEMALSGAEKDALQSKLPPPKKEGGSALPKFTVGHTAPSA